MISLEESEDMILSEDVKMYAEEFRKCKMTSITAKLADDKKSIVPDEERCFSGEAGPDNAHYADFCKSLPAHGQPCISAVHYNLNGQSKVIFVTWCPEGCELRDALLLNVTKYQFSKLVKPDLNVKACEQEDIDEEEIKEQLETGRPPTAMGGIFIENDFSGND